jgi:hypothetical protein
VSHKGKAGPHSAHQTSKCANLGPRSRWCSGLETLIKFMGGRPTGTLRTYFKLLLTSFSGLPCVVSTLTLAFPDTQLLFLRCAAFAGRCICQRAFPAATRIHTHYTLQEMPLSCLLLASKLGKIGISTRPKATPGTDACDMLEARPRCQAPGNVNVSAPL